MYRNADRTIRIHSFIIWMGIYATVLTGMGLAA